MKIGLIGLISMVILFLSCSDMNSQNLTILNSHIDRVYPKEKIDKLEERICTLLKESKAIPESDEVKIYYIPKYSLRDKSGNVLRSFKKSDFIDGSFLNYLSPESDFFDLKIGKVKYIGAEYIVTNSSDSLIGSGTAKMIYLAAIYTKQYLSQDSFLLEKKCELHLKNLFSIEDFLDPIFGIAEDNTIFIFLTLKGRNIVVSTEEFIDMYSKNEIYKDMFYD